MYISNIGEGRLSKKLSGLSGKIPLFGKSGTALILGMVVGVIMEKVLANMATDNEWLAKQLYQGFHVSNLVGLLIPLFLLVILRRVRMLRYFFLGWFLGQAAAELYEWTHGMYGYEPPESIASFGM